MYTATCEASGEQAVSYSKFVDLWQQFCPKVVVTKLMTDLCLTCQQNTTKLVRAANLPEHEKADCIKAQQVHLDCAQTERDFYRETYLHSVATYKDIEEETNLNQAHEPCLFNGTMHYSFGGRSCNPNLRHAKEGARRTINIRERNGEAQMCSKAVSILL